MLKLADISVLEGLQNQAHERMGLQPKMTSMSVFNSPTTLKDKLSRVVPQWAKALSEGKIYEADRIANSIYSALQEEFAQMAGIDRGRKASELELLINKNVLFPLLQQANVPEEAKRELQENAYQMYKQTSPAKKSMADTGHITGIEGGEWVLQSEEQEAQRDDDRLDWRMARAVHVGGDKEKDYPLTERQKQYLDVIRESEKAFPSD